MVSDFGALIEDSVGDIRIKLEKKQYCWKDKEEYT